MLFKKLLYLPAIFFLFSHFTFSQGEKKIIQMSGVVVGADSISGVGGVHIYVPKAGRGTTSNPYGYFTMPVLEEDSLIIKGKGIIEITTKYSKIDPESLKEIEENIYAMKINCLTDQFKDISVNGKKISTAKWQVSNGDKLLDDVILDSCKNV